MNQSICFVGDIHGQTSVITNFIQRYKIENQIFIQVGDFGVGFVNKEHQKEKLRILNLFLQKDNNKFYVIRGNHDDPDYFRGDHKYSNLIFLEDYTTFEILGKKIFFCGGAISIDRCNRIKGSSYWPNEKFVFDIDKINQVKCDIVVTHSAPISFYPAGCDAPIVKSWVEEEKAVKGTDLMKDLLEERNQHQDMFKILASNNQIDLWVYGHFHQSNKNFLDKTEIKLVDINEFYNFVIE